MNIIRFTANPDTNYVYHMLSAARCGYDNDYGSAVRDLYPAEDLAVLKEYENLLTVSGGEHCGALYGLLVGTPACAEMPAKDYYSSLLRMVENGEVPEEGMPYIEPVVRVSQVMIRHYDHYIRELWKKEEEKILAFIPPVQKAFEDCAFTNKADALVGSSLPSGSFTATLVTSVAYGAEAIDISDALDVFGIERSVTDAVFFIGHEYIIYLLMTALQNEDAFRRFETWGLTEGLAEYYLKRILGKTGFFNDQEEYIRFYEQCTEGKTLSAAGLYREAVRKFL